MTVYIVTYIEIYDLLTISNDVILTHFHCNVLYQTMLFHIFNIVCIIVSLKF